MLKLLVVLAAALAAGPGVWAEQTTQLTQPATAFTLTLPSATLEAAKVEFSTGGVSWDVIRRNGLSLNVQGAGEFTASIAALAVNRGRVLRVWRSSARRQLSTGTTTLFGRDFIPDSRFLDGILGVVGAQAGTMLAVADAMRAIDSGSLPALLDGTTASSASGVVFVALPESTASQTTTASGRFPRTETFGN